MGLRGRVRRLGRRGQRPPQLIESEPPPLPRQALLLDLELEERQLGGYRERFEQAEAIGLPDVSEALRPLLEQTQDHVRDLRGALGQ